MGEAPPFLLLHTRSCAPGGRRASTAAAGSSQYAGQHGRDENKKVTVGVGGVGVGRGLAGE